MKYLLFLFTPLTLLFSGNTDTQYLQLEYKVINKLEIPQAHLEILLDNLMDHYEGISGSDLQLGIVSNDGKTKRVLVEFDPSFVIKNEMRVFLSCSGGTNWRHTDFTEILTTEPQCIVDEIAPNSNIQTIPLQCKLTAPSHSKPALYHQVVRFTLSDY